jgi:hypothetical protein
MAADRFRVPDADKKPWGKLIKAWAKGERARPANLAELKSQCVSVGMAEPEIPSFITGLVFVQNDRHILTIRLPPKELIEAGESELREDPNAVYPLPRFYADFFRDPPPAGEEKIDLQAARIGEYSVNSCQ